MFNWLFESKIQNVSKAIHERTNKIISTIKDKPLNIKNKKNFINYLIQNDIEISPQETDETSIILIVIKDFWKWEGTAMHGRPAVSWIAAIESLNGKDFSECSLVVLGWYQFKGFSIHFNTKKPKEVLLHLDSNDKGPEAEEFFYEVQRLGNYKVKK
jgi:hypothetical protein